MVVTDLFFSLLLSKLFLFKINWMSENKIIATSGGTGGIGRALVKIFLQRGAMVATCGRRPEKRTQPKNEFPDKTLFAVAADVSKEEDCKNFIEKTTEEFNGIDLLINNAGISMRALLKDTDLTTLKRVMDINCWGSVYCTRNVLNRVIERKGSIVGIASIEATGDCRAEVDIERAKPLLSDGWKRYVQNSWLPV